MNLGQKREDVVAQTMKFYSHLSRHYVADEERKACLLREQYERRKHIRHEPSDAPRMNETCQHRNGRADANHRGSFGVNLISF